MSKLSEKKKIEEIAKNFLLKQKSYKNINTMNEINSKNIENLYSLTNGDKNNNEETMKDSLSMAKNNNQKYSVNKEIKEIKKNHNNYSQFIPNGRQNNSQNNVKFCSSVKSCLTECYYYCCPKNLGHMNSQIEERNINNNDINNILEHNENINNDKNEHNKNIVKKSSSKSSLFLLESNFDNSIIDENTLDVYNKILVIYKDLMNDFSNNNLKEKKDHFKSQALSCDYFKFLFNDKIFLFIKYFNYSIDVIKFFIYQIFIFWSILYIDENKEFNECSEMAYRTIFLYSSQNYELLLNIIKKIVNPSESKNIKSIISRNKIIFSILKTLIPIKFSKYHPANNIESVSNNNNINDISFYLLDEIERKTKSNRSNELKNNLYNKLKKLLFDLKNNEKLNNKIDKIEKEYILYIRKNNNELSEEKEEKKNLILPEMDKNKKYSLFIELDETLVHYYEEGNNYFVKVRCGTEDFLKTMSEFCEIIIVSTSSKEYTDIIIQNINSDKCYINYTICKEMFDDKNDIVDFSLINRDIKKCIFICHEYDFFNAPKENIIKLNEFLGEENDREILYLQVELMNLSVKNVEDVTIIIRDILNIIQNKYLK